MTTKPHSIDVSNKRDWVAESAMCLCHAVLPVVLQVLPKQDSGEYACIAEDKLRYHLGEVKEELMAAMGLYHGHLTRVVLLMLQMLLKQDSGRHADWAAHTQTQAYTDF
jgi:hypothetical protein